MDDGYPVKYPLKSFFKTLITDKASLCYLIALTNKPFEKHLSSYNSTDLLSISANLWVAHAI
jgi:hypothetical protein